MKNKIVGVFVLTLMVVSSITAIGIDIEEKNSDKMPADLSMWQPVYYDFINNTETEGKWVLSNDMVHAEQIHNCDPCFLLDPTPKSKCEIACRFKVDYIHDDDWIGFTFGYQSKSNFYIMDWCSTVASDPRGFEGFSIKEINAPSEFDLGPINFKTKDGHESTYTTVLDSKYGAGQGWQYNIWYDFYLSFNKGTFTVTVKKGDGTILYTKTISNGIYKNGQFGFYAESQEAIFEAYLDQQQQKTDEMHWLDYSVPNWQQFKNKGDTLEAVDLHIGCYYGGSDDITLSIEEIVGGTPLTSVTYAATDLPDNTQEWFTFDVPNVKLNNNGMYYIVLRFGIGSEYAWSGAHNNPYPDGISSHPDSDWDFAFKTIVNKIDYKSKTRALYTTFQYYLENHTNLLLLIRLLLGLL